jgi:4-amino-4-deoxy-L-arabinose transferase-like glycosyltransferase
LKPHVSARFTPGLNVPTVIVFLAAVTAVRLLLAGMIPLTEDEAYYRLWSTRLQLGYFDHPPMVAWWIAAGRGLIGDTSLGTRFLAVLASAATAVLLIDAVRALRLGGRTALRAGLWLNATLLIGAGGLLAIPDAPTVLFWTATLWALAHATRAAPSSDAGLRWWIVAGFAAGLAVLSKYSALFIAPGVLLWLCATAENRRRLLTPGPWSALGAAIIVISPHIAWNSVNGWVSVLKQAGRVAGRSFEPVHLADLVGGQFLLLNPIIAVFAAGAILRTGVSKSPEALLWLTSLPFLIYLAVHSLHDPVQAHWSAPLYPALVGLAAVAAGRAGRPGAREGRWRLAAPVVGIGLASVVLIFAAVPALDGLAGTATRPLRGWPQFAHAIQSRAQPADGAPTAWVGTMSYGLAAQLAAEPALTLPVVQLNDRARYDPLPPTAVPDFERPGLVIDLPRRVTSETLRSCFRQVEELAPIRRGGGEVSATVQVEYAAFRVWRPINIESGGCWRKRDIPTLQRHPKSVPDQRPS